jgi:DNA polymerase-3 subunit epsilon
VDVQAQLAIPLPVAPPGAAGTGSLADRLCVLLERRGRPLEVGHVASQLLRLTRCPPRLQRRLVGELIEGDGRLAWIGRDLVGLAPAGWHTMPIEEARLTVVDIETTGGAPGSGRITEIGAVRVRGLEPVARFDTLVDPGRPIPESIHRLTGITDEMVAGAPRIDEAMAGLVEFAGDDVLVAHNAPFDLRFLNYERRKADGRYFTQGWIDTLVLARRLLRGRAGGHDLATLSRWAHTSVRPTHRALPDAEATAELLAIFCGMLIERGMGSLARVVSFAGLRGARHAYKLALAEDLPALPGVYLMRDRDGRVLYVGKAANLRRRVRSYFGPQGQHGRLIGRALEGLERVDHEVCGSELEALLREGRLLRELTPPCNRRGLATGGAWLRLSDDPLPRLAPTRRPRGGGACFGPVRSPRLARSMTDTLSAAYGLRACVRACEPGADPAPGCLGPCGAGDPAAYAEAAAEVAAILAGDPGPLADLPGRLAVAAAAGRLGEDGGREATEALVAGLAALSRTRRALARSAVLVQPAASDGVALAMFVGRGRVLRSVELTRRRWRALARAGLAEVRAAEEGPATPHSPGELEEALIVEDHLRASGRDPRVVRLLAGWEDGDALERIRAAVVAAVGAAPGRPDGARGAAAR